MLIEEGGYRQDGRIYAVAFVVPGDATWTQPLYEAAIETARRGWSLGIADVRYWFVTPEPVPLTGFGASLEPEGITFVGSTFADLRPGVVFLDPRDERLEVDCVVTLADVSRHLPSPYFGHARRMDPPVAGPDAPPGRAAPAGVRVPLGAR